MNSGAPKGKPFLLQTLHPSGYCCHKPGDKPWIRKRPDCVYIYMCTWTFDTVRLIHVILRSVLIKYTNDDQFFVSKNLISLSSRLAFGHKRRPLFFFWFFLLLFEYLACEKSCCITWSNESQINVMIHTWSLNENWGF
jgi:hypothetical protein